MWAKNWAITDLFKVFFSFIQTNKTNDCRKCPPNIWCWDPNTRLLELESPPVTTIPAGHTASFFCGQLPKYLVITWVVHSSPCSGHIVNLLLGCTSGLHFSGCTSGLDLVADLGPVLALYSFFVDVIRLVKNNSWTDSWKRFNGHISPMIDILNIYSFLN